MEQLRHPSRFNDLQLDLEFWIPCQIVYNIFLGNNVIIVKLLLIIVLTDLF